MSKVHRLYSGPIFWSGDSPYKGQVEADGQLEVQLNGCTLVVSSNRIFDLNVNLQQRTKSYDVFPDCRGLLILGPAGNTEKWSDLGSIKSTITRVQFPWLPKLIQAVLQLLSCMWHRLTHNLYLNNRKQLLRSRTSHAVFRNLVQIYLHFYISIFRPVQI